MNEISSGTVLITGPTGGLGRSATMAMASRPEGDRPDLLLIGRPGNALAGVAAEARAAGATAREIGCDLARRQMGNVAIAQEECRDMWSFVKLDRLLQDLGYAVRLLRPMSRLSTIIRSLLWQ